MSQRPFSPKVSTLILRFSIVSLTLLSTRKPPICPVSRLDSPCVWEDGQRLARTHGPVRGTHLSSVNYTRGSPLRVTGSRADEKVRHQYYSRFFTTFHQNDVFIRAKGKTIGM